MSALTATSGEPQSVGDPGQVPPTEFLELIGETVDQVRALALYELLRMRLVREVIVPTPAAGADWTQTVPAGETWELLLVRHVLTTSATVANRSASIVLKDDGAATLGRLTPVAVQAAGAGVTYTLYQGLGTEHNQTEMNMSLPTPAIPFGSGYSIGSLTSNLDAGDQYSSVKLLVRAWSVGQVYWAADLIGRELGFEHLSDLPASTPLPEGTGQAIPVSPLAR